MQLLWVAAINQTYNQNFKWKWKNSSMLRDINQFFQTTHWTNFFTKWYYWERSVQYRKDNYQQFHSTSPSGEKLSAEIAVVNTVPEAVDVSKLGSPGGPLASKTFIIVTLHTNKGFHYRKLLSLVITERINTSRQQSDLDIIIFKRKHKYKGLFFGRGQGAYTNYKLDYHILFLIILIQHQSSKWIWYHPRPIHGSINILVTNGLKIGI
jgi:hypothetical protein